MGGETAVFVCIVIAMFFMCLSAAGALGIWYIKQSVKEIFEYLTEDEDEEEEEEKKIGFQKAEGQ